MSFRNRPVLERKHRPRWQDELRTQQLVVAGFAVAIALALGIFGATSWNAYWSAHLRPVASVDGVPISRSQLAAREAIVTAELIAEATEVQAQAGVGPRDSLLQQQLQAIQTALNDVTSAASTSLVDGAVLASQGDAFEVVVTDDEVSAEVVQRRQLAERVRVAMILVNALPDDTEPGTEPTEEQRQAARTEAAEARSRVEGGEDFATVATEVSDDFTSSLGGELGWIADGDAVYDEQFKAVRDAEVDELIGPVEVESGWTVLKLVERREAGEDETLVDLLAAAGVGDDAYRSYVRDRLLASAFQTHFEDEVVVSPQPQRRVAQIFMAAGTEPYVVQERARHVLVQPLPDADDQSTATEEQWAAALAEAEQVRELVDAPDADWFAVAGEHSDDPGSGAQGGDLGWYDPTAPGFVEEFATALADLEEGGISEPVRTSFGYHVIQKTGARTSPVDEAAELVDILRADPDAFAATARLVSEEYESARADGELGWVAHYQLDQASEEAIFALAEPGDISDPVGLDDGIYVFQLLEASDEQEVEAERLAQIRQTGFLRWLEQDVKAEATIWTDPEFASTSA
ncbi:MAG: peptidylprolyl isomerase [Candidatus Limnocylindria bacterium]